MEKKDQHRESAERLVVLLRERARNLFETRQLMCAEAVMVALNQGLRGGLTDTQAIAMAAPFCLAMGDSGCVCGALSGAVMACGLFLGKDQPYRHRKELRESARNLHDGFRASNGATCCRILCKRVKRDKKAHFQQCAGLTANATELAAQLILEKRPMLILQVDKDNVLKRSSKFGGLLLRLYRFLGCSRSMPNNR